eukprot:Pompholyxophrys_punicea_v1_NODE_144_length_3209_cov_54.434686.p1 type:complete len:655 gc:universal NODE_144_length_3209_cov_54.434686:2046-82(-)
MPKVTANSVPKDSPFHFFQTRGVCPANCGSVCLRSSSYNVHLKNCSFFQSKFANELNMNETVMHSAQKDLADPTILNFDSQAPELQHARADSLNLNPLEIQARDFVASDSGSSRETCETNTVKKRGRPKTINPSQKTLKNRISAFKSSIKELEEETGILLEDLLRKNPLKEQFAENVVQAFKKLPQTSPLRQGLLALLQKNCNIKELSELLGVSPLTIRRCRNISDESNFLLSQKYKPHVTRKKLSDEKINFIKNYWEDSCAAVPYKSTIVKPRNKEPIHMPYFEQRQSDSEIVQKFTSLAPFRASAATLKKYKPKTIHSIVQKFCICHHCVEGNDAKQKLMTLRNQIHKECRSQCAKDSTCPVEANLSLSKKVALRKCLDEVKDYKFHKEIADHQSLEFKKKKTNVLPGECVIVMDFAGRFLVKADINLSQKDYFARFGVPDFVLVAYFYSFNEGKIVTKTFDFISKTESKEDINYVIATWLYLLNETNFLDQFKKVYVFSDGGPKHFKIRKSIYFFSILQAYYGIRFEWHYFQSCHGKSGCDAHVGVLKMMLLREIKKGEIINNESDLYEKVKESSKSDVIFIDVPEYNFDCTEFKYGIKKYFFYSFEGIGVIRCHQKSGDEKYCLQKITNSGAQLPENSKQINRIIAMELC